MAKTDFFRKDYEEGSPLRLVGNAYEANMVRSGLDNMKGLGCRVEKTVNGDQFYITVVVDGTSDDLPPDQFAGSDVKCAVDSLDASDYLGNQFQPFDTNGYVSGTDIPVSHDVVSDCGDRLLRMYLDVESSGTPTKVLGKTAGGALVWVLLTDTCG